MANICNTSLRSFLVNLVVPTMFGVVIIRHTIATATSDTLLQLDRNLSTVTHKEKGSDNADIAGVSRRVIPRRTTEAGKRLVTRSMTAARERRSSSRDPCHRSGECNYTTSVASTGCPFGDDCPPTYDMTSPDVDLLCASGDCRTNNATSSSMECPSSECDCRTLHSTGEIIVRCTHTTHGRFIPSFQSSNVTFASLVIARLNLTHVGDNAFHNIRTRALDLSGNLLAKNGCSDDAFSGLELVLQVLSVSESGLVRIPGAIGKLINLRTLYLDGNRLQTLRRASFRRNSKLKQLFLQRCLINRIDIGAFDGLKLLQELRLSDNKISSIPVSLFTALSRLTSLDLSNNFIHRLTPGTFQSLSSLQLLQLRSNIFHIVSRSMFSGLTGLSDLKLDSNPLLAVDNNSFSEMRKLKYLSLDVSATTNITAGAMRGLGRLKTLSFGTISRERLPSGMFDSMRGLLHLSVQDGKDVFRGFTVDLFRSDMNFGQLNVLAGAIHHCRCTTEWIRQLVERGASVQGSCGQTQLINCARVAGN